MSLRAAPNHTTAANTVVDFFERQFVAKHGLPPTFPPLEAFPWRPCALGEWVALRSIILDRSFMNPICRAWSRCIRAATGRSVIGAATPSVAAAPDFATAPAPAMRAEGHA
jgi:hypothetical protein